MNPSNILKKAPMEFFNDKRLKIITATIKTLLVWMFFIMTGVVLIGCHRFVVKKKSSELTSSNGVAQVHHVSKAGTIPTPFMINVNEEFVAEMQFPPDANAQFLLKKSSTNKVFGSSLVSIFVESQQAWLPFMQVNWRPDSEPLVFSCASGKKYLLNVHFLQSSPKGWSVTFDCPQTFNLDNKEGFLDFQNTLSHAKGSPTIGYLILRRGKSYRFTVPRSVTINIGGIIVLDDIGQNLPSQIRFAVDPSNELIKKIMSLGIKKQADRWLTYPIDRDLLIAEIYRRFIDPYGSETMEEIRRKHVPEVVVTLNHLYGGSVSFISEVSRGPAGLSGDQLAPDFFRSKIMVDAPNGKDGGIAYIFFVLDTQTCVKISDKIDGDNGHNGVYPGISGSDGFDPIPGPTLAVFLTEKSNILDQNRNLVMVMSSPVVEPAPGGSGTRGQNGGKGGKPATVNCGSAVGNRGKDGHPAPRGLDGRPSSVTYDCPHLLVTDDMPSQVFVVSGAQCEQRDLRRINFDEFKKSRLKALSNWIQISR
ncbi:MAG: hypothetical protein NZ480_09440 [Bdellovibrionaceae bacterium]|nr:hypothetical protein [Pseudobdellovibrionaceae bacterium]MDW8191018.1 hypothetical protein [Pseudobdellovibrionaceae bacterium]